VVGSVALVYSSVAALASLCGVGAPAASKQPVHVALVHAASPGGRMALNIVPTRAAPWLPLAPQGLIHFLIRAKE
jgi:hypothetical protein